MKPMTIQIKKKLQPKFIGMIFYQKFNINLVLFKIKSDFHFRDTFSTNEK